MAFKELVACVNGVAAVTGGAHPRLQALVEAARLCGPIPVAIAYPCDGTSLNAAIEATRVGLVTPILVGPRDRIEAAAAQGGIDLTGVAFHETADDPRIAATQAAALCRDGKAAALMKGKSSLQTAIGIKHPKIVQKSSGFLGGSFNTREFFHGQSHATLRSVKWIFLAATFAVPVLLLAIVLTTGSVALLPVAFVVQFLGLLAERWFFFAQANHPQNIYYQAVN